MHKTGPGYAEPFIQAASPLPAWASNDPGPSAAAAKEARKKAEQAKADEAAHTWNRQEARRKAQERSEQAMGAGSGANQKERQAMRTLGIDPSVTPDRATIRAAWKALSLKFHPDKYDGPEEQREANAAKFRETQEAYEFLTKP